MEAIYALGACVAPPIESLSRFNFSGGNPLKSQYRVELKSALEVYREIVVVVLLCAAVLGGVFFYFQMKLKDAQKQYDQLSASQGAYSSKSLEDIQVETKQNTDQLAQNKNIRTKSDVALILLKVASHLPKGVSLTEFQVDYKGDISNMQVSIEMSGSAVKEDPNEQITIVDQVYSDLKKDKSLSPFIKSVNLVSLRQEENNGRKMTTFTIRCS